MKSHSMLLGVWESVREWTSTFPSELPLWELESQWTLKFSENDCKGQNPLDCGVLYIIGKILELKCLKLGSHDPFGYLKHKFWPKEGSGVKLSI